MASGLAISSGFSVVYPSQTQSIPVGSPQHVAKSAATAVKSQRISIYSPMSMSELASAYAPVECALGRLEIPPDMVGASLDFLDGRSLTQFEMVSRGARRAMDHDYPDMYKRLLMRQLYNVPQVGGLPSKDGKRALIAWDAGDFHPFLASCTSQMIPPPRYLHRVALAGDGWYYLFGGRLEQGMSGDVWRFRVKPSRARRGHLSIHWELVDGEAGRGTMNTGNGLVSGSENGVIGTNQSVNADADEDWRDYENEGPANVGPVIEPPQVIPQDTWHGHGIMDDVHLLQVANPAEGQAGFGGNGEAAVAETAHGEATGTNTRKRSPRPCARCAASWTCSPGSNKIYLFGGQGLGDNFLGDLWCFHAGGRDECRWELLKSVVANDAPDDCVEGGQEEAPEALEGRWGHTMVEHRGALYMFGGSFPGQACAGLWRLDTSVRPCLWTFLRPGGKKPPARGGHSATVMGDTLYIFGGNTTEEVFNDMWAIDLPGCSAWSQVPQTPDFPSPRIGHSAIAIGNRILIYGGRTFETDRYTTGISCFDTDEQCFLSFPHAEAFSDGAKAERGMWSGLRMTGHSAVLCSRGLLFVGGLVPPGYPIMTPWVLDVFEGRRRRESTRDRRRPVLGTAGGCATS